MEKVKSQPGIKPVPMKLFATWEVDRTPSNCIPRLCSLSISRLTVLKGLGNDVNTLTIAVKVQGSKRTLRSNEITLQTDGKLDTELQLNFSLQYPHFLKREGNKLHVMLQRRKKYKNRTFLGYKTLAEGVVNMSQVLQREMDMELDLVNDKDGKNILAKVSVQAVNSQPVDYESNKNQDRITEYTDDEDEFSSNEECSDSEPMLDELRRRAQPVTVHRNQQQNLKQRFIALLKKFKLNEDALMPEMAQRKLSGGVGEMDPSEIANFFEELEDLSDSGPEIDTVSITSTPKPSLRPFFASTKSLLTDVTPDSDRVGEIKKDSDSHNDSEPTPSSSPPKIDEKDKSLLSNKDASLITKKKIRRDKACGLFQFQDTPDSQDHND